MEKLEEKFRRNIKERTIKKTLASIVLVTAIGLGGCGKGESNIDYNFQRQPTPVAEVPVINYRVSAFSAISAIDFDKDGDIDLLVVDYNDGKVYVYDNKDNQFHKSQKPIAEVPLISHRGASIAVVDWDKDGMVDILALDGSDGKVYLYKNTHTIEESK